MIPFLKDKNKNSAAGVSIEIRKPDMPESQENQGLMECMKQLISALQTSDSKAAAQAFKDAIEICGSYGDEYQDEQDSE